MGGVWTWTEDSSFDRIELDGQQAAQIASLKRSHRPVALMHKDSCVGVLLTRDQFLLFQEMARILADETVYQSIQDSYDAIPSHADYVPADMAFNTR